VPVCRFTPLLSVAMSPVLASSTVTDAPSVHEPVPLSAAALDTVIDSMLVRMVRVIGTCWSCNVALAARCTSTGTEAGRNDGRLGFVGLALSVYVPGLTWLNTMVFAVGSTVQMLSCPVGAGTRQVLFPLAPASRYVPDGRTGVPKVVLGVT